VSGPAAHRADRAHRVRSARSAGPFRRRPAGAHRASRRPAVPAHRRIAVRLSPGPLGLVLAAAVLATGTGALGGLVPTSGRTAAAAPATPAPRVTQPTAIEPLSTYLPQVSCNPVAMPGAVALGDLLRATYPGTSYGIARACGSDGMASEHYEGRAVDWMVSKRTPAQLAQARSLIAWLLATDKAGRPYANARRLGVMYLIWDDHIWGAYRPGDGWRPYSTCARHPEPASDTACHRDHVHISLSWAGATGRTSFWTGRVAAADYGPCRPADLNWAAPYTGPRSSPCPPHPTVAAPKGASSVAAALYRASGAQLGPRSSGPLVAALQRALRLTADGSFGPMTGAAVSAFRVSHGLRAGQVVDAATWRALLAAVATGAGSAPAPSPRPTPAPAPAPRPAPGGPLAPYVGLVLTYDSSGPAVTAVQRLLGVTPTGWFGPRTQAAVRAFQLSHHIPTTGNVGPLTWAALTKVAAARR
jgi:peptidoglycan hydrolase-like protein with peptidoglycan-binding domain